MLEALNDYLLALRFVLEGGGPADLGLAMRVAALCVEPELRDEAKATVDRAVALERELWSGEPPPRRRGPRPPAETAAGIEDLTRAILETRPAATWEAICARPPTRSCSPTARGRGGRRRAADGSRSGLPDTEHRRSRLQEEIEQAPVAEQALTASPERHRPGLRPKPIEEKPARGVKSESPATSRASRVDEQLWLHIRETGRRATRLATRRRPCRSRSPRVESGSSHAPSRRRTKMFGATHRSTISVTSRESIP